MAVRIVLQVLFPIARVTVRRKAGFVLPLLNPERYRNFLRRVSGAAGTIQGKQSNVDPVIYIGRLRRDLIQFFANMCVKNFHAGASAEGPVREVALSMQMRDEVELHV